MKILIPTPVLPEKKSIRINYVNKILSELKKTEKIQVIWLVYLPDKFRSYSSNETEILDIHDFDDGVDILKKLQPDCILIGSHFEPIQYSLSLTAKHLHIPLVSFFYYDYNFESVNSRNKTQFVQYTRMISSKTVPSDTKNESKFLRRFRFISYKFSFLNKTEFVLNISKLPNSIFLIKNIINHYVFKKIPINLLPDLFLLPNSSWMKPLLKLGVDEKKLLVTGNPLWDNPIFQSVINKKINENSKISILIITDSLPQHGIWSLDKFSSFINLLLSTLSKDSQFLISFKIHPASENKQFYENLFQNYNQKFPIFQNESIWNIINDYDIILSFGYSTIHSEIALSGKKMILLDFDFNFPYIDFVDQGIESGNIQSCTNINSLNKLIITFAKTELNLNKYHEQLKNKFNITGQSSKLCSESIKNLINNENF